MNTNVSIVQCLLGLLRAPLGLRRFSNGLGCKCLFTAGGSSGRGISLESTWLVRGADGTSRLLSLVGADLRLS